MKNQNITRSAILSVALFLMVVVIVDAWGPGAVTPPAGNVPTPVHRLAGSQVKSGGFWANGGIGSDSGYCLPPSNCILAWPTEPWRSSGSDIYYSGTGVSVGVGLQAPVATLDVGGAARLAPQTSMPIACNATYKGSIAVTSYNYEICICNGASWIFDSTGAACVFGGDGIIPTTPAGLSASVISYSQINLSWSASTDNVGVTGYEIYRDNSLIATTAGTTYNNTGLSGSTSYTYTVRAYDAAGNVSSNSTSVTQTTSVPPDTTAPSTPTGLTATAVSTSQINLSWSASTDNVAVTGYQIYRGGTLIGSTAGTTYNNTGLSASTAYSYTVRAYDAASNYSAQSTSQSATTQSPVTPGSTTYSTPGSYTFPVQAYNSLTVEVWGGGGGGAHVMGGAAGGQSRFNNTVYANGGTGGTITWTVVAGGTAWGGDVNTQGGSSNAFSGGSSPNGGAGGGTATNGTAPGGGGGSGATAGQQGGGGGGYSRKTYTAGQLSVGSGLPVVVGSGGAAGWAPYSGAGAPGRVIITWN